MAAAKRQGPKNRVKAAKSNMWKAIDKLGKVTLQLAKSSAQAWEL
jgi:hypothetical protein